LSKDPFKPVRRSRVGHLMISEHFQQWMLGDLCICQPRVPERRSGLLNHLTLCFIVSFSTKCGMFFIYRWCTPPDRLYGITDRSISWSRSIRANWRGLYGITARSISVDRGLYRPISIQEVFTFDS
jgi:hypothetical protein